MAFKLPSLNGRVSSDKSLNREGLPLFDWNHLKDKEDAIGQGFQGPSGTPHPKIYRVPLSGFFTQNLGHLIFEAFQGVPTKA